MNHHHFCTVCWSNNFRGCQEKQMGDNAKKTQHRNKTSKMTRANLVGFSFFFSGFLAFSPCIVNFYALRSCGRLIIIHISSNSSSSNSIKVWFFKLESSGTLSSWLTLKFVTCHCDVKMTGQQCKNSTMTLSCVYFCKK